MEKKRIKKTLEIVMFLLLDFRSMRWVTFHLEKMVTITRICQYIIRIAFNIYDVDDLTIFDIFDCSIHLIHNEYLKTSY